MSLLVGTSGFDYKDWRGPFYPRFLKVGDRLALYAEHFDTVELNVTFYRMPKAEAFRGWRDAVPDDFRFAVKASRYLTHIKRLEDPQGPVEFLMERASELGDKLGVVLLQLPPSLAIDLGRLDDTLRAFRGAVPIAVEPRHKSWFVPELCDLLRQHGAAFVLADRRGPITPLWTSTDWTYLRLHQGRATPRPCYGRHALASWVDRLAALEGGDRGYVYFNNDHRACAVHNARTFEALLLGAQPTWHRVDEARDDPDPGDRHARGLRTGAVAGGATLGCRAWRHRPDRRARPPGRHEVHLPGAAGSQGLPVPDRRPLVAPRIRPDAGAS